MRLWHCDSFARRTLQLKGAGERLIFGLAGSMGARRAGDIVWPAGSITLMLISGFDFAANPRASVASTMLSHLVMRGFQFAGWGCLAT